MRLDHTFTHLDITQFGIFTGIKITSTVPTLTFEDTTSGHDDWRLIVDADDFVVQQNVNDAAWTTRLTFSGSQITLPVTNSFYFGTVGYLTSTASTVDLISTGQFTITSSTATTLLATTRVNIQTNASYGDVYIGTGGITRIGDSSSYMEFSASGVLSSTGGAWLDDSITIEGRPPIRYSVMIGS